MFTPLFWLMENLSTFLKLCKIFCLLTHCHVVKAHSGCLSIQILLRENYEQRLYSHMIKVSHVLCGCRVSTRETLPGVTIRVR